MAKFEGGQLVWIKANSFYWPAIIMNEEQASNVGLLKHADKMSVNVYRVVLIGYRLAYIVSNLFLFTYLYAFLI